MLNPTSVATVFPMFDSAFCPPLVVRGCHWREIYATATYAPMRENEKRREPSSLRARKELATAYFTRAPAPVFRDGIYRLSSCNTSEALYMIVCRKMCCA